MSLPTPPVFSLLDVCRSIQKTLSARYGSPFWVRAEMHKLNRYPASGHCFPDLLQKEGNRIVAQMRATLWRSDYERIDARFRQTVHEPLQEGIEILFEASIQYDPQYGLSLRILDIDPTYVLGSLERERALCVQRLKEENLWERNRSLPLPLLPARIALISASTSKGYSDFMQVLQRNEYGYSFYVHLFPALLQGEGASDSIQAALQAVQAFPLRFDLAVIIRGGGGEVGLNAYNHYELARTVCQYPIPVLTGIGHSTNLTVTEEVAWFHGITPTELAVFILKRFEEFHAVLDYSEERLRLLLEELFLRERHRLHHTEALLKTPGLRLRHENQALESMEDRLRRAVFSAVRTGKERIDNIEKTLHWADPKRNLKMGYTLTYQGDKLLFSGEKIKEGQPLRTVFAEGELLSRAIAFQPDEVGKKAIQRANPMRNNSRRR